MSSPIEPKILDLHAVVRRFGEVVSVRTMRDIVKRPDFPRPIALNDKCKRLVWRTEEVDAFIAALPPVAATRPEPPQLAAGKARGRAARLPERQPEGQ